MSKFHTLRFITSVADRANKNTKVVISLKRFLRHMKHVNKLPTMPKIISKSDKMPKILFKTK